MTFLMRPDLTGFTLTVSYGTATVYWSSMPNLSSAYFDRSRPWSTWADAQVHTKADNSNMKKCFIA